MQEDHETNYHRRIGHHIQRYWLLRHRLQGEEEMIEDGRVISGIAMLITFIIAVLLLTKEKEK